MVAPHVGAWIEISKRRLSLRKFSSLPTWERGLKYSLAGTALLSPGVAPHVGAWIEISRGMATGLMRQSRSPRGSVD